MYDFYKNENGEYIEGYLSSREEFNGIVFLLREPNDDRPKYFWFKNAITDKKIYKDSDTAKEKKKSKIAATKYKNRFVEMLKAVGFDGGDLHNAVYCNVHPEYGESSQTSEYGKTMKSKSIEMIETLSEEHKKLIIFTCRDIYANLKNCFISQNYLKPDEENKDGLKYKRGNLSWFQVEKASCKIKVYEMYHPSFSGKIELKKETN